jgi:Mg2+/Co2+ transporter CorB
VNFSAATVATVIGFQLMGDTGVLLAPWILTIVFLIFAEVAPKTLAAERPESWALKAVFILKPLQKVLMPAVALVNVVSNALVRPFLPSSDDDDQLTTDELKTVVVEGATSVGERQRMLTRILDLESVTVDDIMVPRAEIAAINIDDALNTIMTTVAASQHTLLPIYKDSFDNVLGILHLRRVARLIFNEDFSKADLLQLTREPYYVPEATPLHTQLFNFQKERQRLALVVDEYGDIQGIVTLEDILEEIVGEFTSDYAANMPEISPQEDGSFVIDGMAVLRDINRALKWDLPINGPKTLSGFVLEHLETIPETNVCLRAGDYRIETRQIKDNIVKSLIIRRQSTPQPDTEDVDAED